MGFRRLSVPPLWWQFLGSSLWAFLFPALGWEHAWPLARVQRLAQVDVNSEEADEQGECIALKAQWHTISDRVPNPLLHQLHHFISSGNIQLALYRDGKTQAPALLNIPCWHKSMDMEPIVAQAGAGVWLQHNVQSMGERAMDSAKGLWAAAQQTGLLARIATVKNFNPLAEFEAPIKIQILSQYSSNIQ